MKHRHGCRCLVAVVASQTDFDGATEMILVNRIRHTHKTVRLVNEKRVNVSTTTIYTCDTSTLTPLATKTGDGCGSFPSLLTFAFVLGFKSSNEAVGIVEACTSSLFPPCSMAEGGFDLSSMAASEGGSRLQFFRLLSLQLTTIVENCASQNKRSSRVYLNALGLKNCDDRSVAQQSPCCHSKIPPIKEWLSGVVSSVGFIFQMRFKF